MLRYSLPPRLDWVEKVEKLGFLYHTHNGVPYWNESAYYAFTSAEILELEKASKDLHEMCLEAIDVIIAKDWFSKMGIRPEVAAVIKQVWDEDPPAIYGRFDLIYDGIHPPKMLEYNADTPTSLLEAAVIQWHWLEERFPDYDQFNRIWEALVEKWQALKAEGVLKGKVIHFTAEDSPEDALTITMLRDTAIEAGHRTAPLGLGQIGWNAEDQHFRDHQEGPIKTIFKLYPWELMMEDKFGEYALKSMDKTQWIEPIWKMLLSNKAILAILWELNPGHPNLLASSLTAPVDPQNYVQKPFLSREGANVKIVSGGATIAESGGEYGASGHVYQEFIHPPDFGGVFPVLGSWIVDGASVGMGVRESNALITDDLAKFVPHMIADSEPN